METLDTPQNEPLRLAERLRKVQVGVRAELDITRHVFHGRPAYVVRDPVTFQSHQLSAADYRLYCYLSPDHNLGSIFQQIVRDGLLDAEREEEFYRFVLQLNQLGLLNLPTSDGHALYERHKRRRAAARKARLLGILFLRVPLWDPDRFLDRTIGWMRPLFTRTAFVAWLLLSLLSMSLCVARWQDFRQPLGAIFAVEHLPTLWITLIGLKVIHEFGHAYACKHFGGNVPEIGAFFILFTPCAYVDASASWGFRERLQRVIVGLAGIYFESFVAIFAFLVWALTEPSAWHAWAQSVVVLSTVVTLGFNLNPLMKYDGYFILCDVMNYPGLRARSQAQIKNWFKRLFFGISAPAIARTRFGAVGLGLWGGMVVVYYHLVLLAICIAIAWKFPGVGVLLAISYATISLVRGGLKLVRYIRFSPEVADRRPRAVAVTATLLAAVPLGLLFLPVPHAPHAVGVVGQAEDHIARAQAEGFLRDYFVKLGQDVDENQPLCRLEDTGRDLAVARQQAEYRLVRLRLRNKLQESASEALSENNRVQQVRRQLEYARQRQAALVTQAPTSGTMTWNAQLDSLGRYVARGEPLAMVSRGPWRVRIILGAEEFTDIAPRLGASASVLFVGQEQDPVSARVVRVAPVGSHEIGDLTLAALQPEKFQPTPDGGHSEQAMFHVELEFIEREDLQLRHGFPAAVRFPTRRISLGTRLYRRSMQFYQQLQAARAGSP